MTLDLPKLYIMFYYVTHKMLNNWKRYILGMYRSIKVLKTTRYFFRIFIQRCRDPQLQVGKNY